MPRVPELDVHPKALAPVTGRPSRSHCQLLEQRTAQADGLHPDPEPPRRMGEAGVRTAVCPVPTLARE